MKDSIYGINEKFVSFAVVTIDNPVSEEDQAIEDKAEGDKTLEIIKGKCRSFHIHGFEFTGSYNGKKQRLYFIFNPAMDEIGYFVECNEKYPQESSFFCRDNEIRYYKIMDEEKKKYFNNLHKGVPFKFARYHLRYEVVNRQIVKDIETNSDEAIVESIIDAFNNMQTGWSFFFDKEAFIKAVEERPIIKNYSAIYASINGNAGLMYSIRLGNRHKAYRDQIIVEANDVYSYRNDGQNKMKYTRALGFYQYYKSDMDEMELSQHVEEYKKAKELCDDINKNIKGYYHVVIEDNDCEEPRYFMYVTVVLPYNYASLEEVIDTRFKETGIDKEVLMKKAIEERKELNYILLPQLKEKLGYECML